LQQFYDICRVDDTRRANASSVRLCIIASSGRAIIIDTENPSLQDEVYTPPPCSY
jgi:hypothetical protein